MYQCSYLQLCTSASIYSYVPVQLFTAMYQCSYLQLCTSAAAVKRTPLAAWTALLTLLWKKARNKQTSTVSQLCFTKLESWCSLHNVLWSTLSEAGMCTIVQWYMHCSVHCIVHCRPVDVTEHARVRPECKWSVLVGSTIVVGGLDRGRRWWWWWWWARR